MMTVRAIKLKINGTTGKRPTISHRLARQLDSLLDAISGLGLKNDVVLSKIISLAVRVHDDNFEQSFCCESDAAIYITILVSRSKQQLYFTPDFDSKALDVTCSENVL